MKYGKREFQNRKKLRLTNRSFFIETTNNKILIRDACKIEINSSFDRQE
ncbi:Uncharacterised protein [uncultured Ruminococcus sp.]|nr:Uncharacterised protein [uncultured Ruminococcus sp.]